MCPYSWVIVVNLDGLVHFGIGEKRKDVWIDRGICFCKISDLSLSIATHAVTSSSMYLSTPTRGRSLRYTSDGWDSPKGMLLRRSLGVFNMCWWGEWTSSRSHSSHSMRLYPKSKVIYYPRKHLVELGLIQRGGIVVPFQSCCILRRRYISTPLLLNHGCAFVVMLILHQISLK